MSVQADAPFSLEAWLGDPAVAALVVDPQGSILCWDVAAQQLFGWAAEETTGRDLESLLGLDHPSGGLLLDSSAAEPEVLPLRARNKLGEAVALKALARPYSRGPGRPAVVVLVADAARQTRGRRHTPPDPVGLLLAERVARVEAQQAVRALGRLQAVASALGETVSVEEGVDRVMKEVAAAAGADALSVYVSNGTTGQFELVANRGSSSKMCEDFRFLSPEVEIPVTEAVRGREAVWVHSLRERRARFPALELAGADSHHAVAALPLMSGGTCVGALALAWRHERSFPAEEQSYLSTLADLCACAVARGQVYDAEHRSRMEAERAAHRVSDLQRVVDAALGSDDLDHLLDDLLQRLCDVLAAEKAAVFSLADEPGFLSLRAVHEVPGPVPTPTRIPAPAAVKSALEEIRPLRIDDARQLAVLGPGTRGWAGSVVTAPLVVADRVTGVVVVAGAAPHVFDDDGAELLAMAARRMATAMERARGFESERRERRHLEVLLGAAKLVSSPLARWEVLDRLVQMAVPTVADWCVLALPRGSAMQRVAVAHADPATDAMCRLLVGQWPFDLAGCSPMAEAFRTGRPVTATELTPEVVQGWVDDDEYASVTEAIGLRSLLVLPVRSRDSTIGAAGFGWTGHHDGHPDGADQDLAEEFARLVAVVLQQAIDAVREHDLAAAFGAGEDRAGSTPANSPAVQVLLVEEFPIVRHGVRLLAERAPDIAICGEAASLAEAEAGAWDPDIVVHGLVLPDGNGPEVVSRLVARFPRARPVVLSRIDQPTYVHLALMAGAKGYLLKGVAAGELVDVLRRVARGEEYVQPSLGSALARWQSIPRRHPAGAGRALTRREQEVLELVALGHTNAEIAATLGVSLRTVETHRSHLAQKLGVRSRAELVSRARELGAGR